MSSTQVPIRFPDDLLAWLRARAEAEHRTLAGTVKALLEETRKTMEQGTDR